ncbi:hypothetical protein [Candidatus Anaplasma sp. TIGMIC]|uniref:hypothetical protein n=1 Tax=Candidatus Anaplasma sp. TIGMIC TaxID=3020713 RepID=UPI00232BF1CE|nr:hypothetical protein [Candidatus Anaplasma sp. TIGMIC]MDB1135466.1 hypothetical protein [Candidatus Anaplasma sp. TIGMIC]
MILDDFSVASVVAAPASDGDLSACGYCSDMQGLTLVESYSYGSGDDGERVTMTFDKENAGGVEQSLMFDAVVSGDNDVKLDNVFLFETSTATPSDNQDGDPIFGSSKHVYFGGLKATATNEKVTEEGSEEYGGAVSEGSMILKARGNNSKCDLAIVLEQDGNAALISEAGLM